MESSHRRDETFQILDYVVFAGIFVISSGIGVFFAIKERKKTTSREFLVGGRQMSSGPVALSLTASFMSAITVLGAPSDVYRFGASFVIFSIAYTLMVMLTAELFVPVFYRSGITSAYEYLELRFCKAVRVVATLIYIVQTIVYTGVVVYAPALALNQVTRFNLWGSIFATGVVCTFYCTLGGLKAVVWSDAFQMVVMVVGFLTVLVQGTKETGGLGVVWDRALNGSRLNVFNFDLDPLKRHTFWTISVGGMFTWLGIYGVNQSTIQRCISCKTWQALALYLNLLGLLVICGCAASSGIIMYAFYYNCDPWTAGYVRAPDQLMPFFVMEILGKLPGLPGLFVACAFSGTLSSVAASINALATVTYEDFVKNCFRNISDRAGTWMSKGLCVVFGAACTAMAVSASYMGGIVQAALSIHGMCGGPMLGIFSLGILFPWTNSKGAAGGLLLGVVLSFWTALGAFVYPAPSHKTLPLPLSTAGCAPTNVTTFHSRPVPTPSLSTLANSWYSMSYLYYSAVGYITTVILGLLITLFTGPTPVEDVKPWLIRPVCNIFCFWSEKYKRICWCGLEHDKEKLDLDNHLSHNVQLSEKDQDLEESTKKDSMDMEQEKSHDNSGFVTETRF
uniref:Solute carrier family 5 member 12 n=1 Tax=Scleropages formosus TaxID=113540 RepID=A0A8C9WNR4_SCLFO